MQCLDYEAAVQLSGSHQSGTLMGPFVFELLGEVIVSGWPEQRGLVLLLSAVTTGHGSTLYLLDACVSGAPSVTCREEIPGNLYCALDSLPYSNAPAVLISVHCTQLSIFLVNSGRVGGEL